MRPGLTWFAINNQADATDMDVLAPLGVEIMSPDRAPMHVHRDPDTGRLVAATGWVVVWRDGRIQVLPRHDTPPRLIDGLVSVAVDCLERNLHIRDEWKYYRATRTQPGQWSAGILRGVPDGRSVFEHHATALDYSAFSTQRPVRDRSQGHQLHV